MYPTNEKPPYPGFNIMPTPYGDTPYPQSNVPYPQSNVPYPQSNVSYPQSNAPYSQSTSMYPQSDLPFQRDSPQHNPSSQPSAPYQSNDFYQDNPPKNFANQSGLNTGYPTSQYSNLASKNAYENPMQFHNSPIKQGNMGENSYIDNPSLRLYTNQGSQGNYNNQSHIQIPNTPKEYAPTVRDFPNFDARLDAESLRKAMKGFGTDEKTIINILTKRSNRQRQQILMQYKMLYGKDLIGDLKSELSGKFEAVILALLTPTIEYDASLLRGAIRGLGTDEDLLIEVLSSRNPADIRQIRQTYQQLFNRDLEKDIINDTSGHFRRLLVSLATGMRDEGTTVDPNMAHRDAEALLKAGVKKLGTDESVFNSILASRNYNQLRATMEEYRRLSGHTLDQAIRSEMSGDLLNAMVSVAKCAAYKPSYFAEKLYYSMKGMGTNDDMLIRIVVTRSEVDMQAIKSEFQRMYGKSLESFISGDCSGDYKRVLIALVQGNI